MSHEQIFMNQKKIPPNVKKVIITGSGFNVCDDFFPLILLLLSHNLTEAFITVDLWVPVHHLLRSAWTQPISRKLYSIFLSVFWMVLNLFILTYVFLCISVQLWWQKGTLDSHLPAMQTQTLRSTGILLLEKWWRASLHITMYSKMVRIWTYQKSIHPMWESIAAGVEERCYHQSIFCCKPMRKMILVR